MARQFFDGGNAQQAGAPPAFAMSRHVLPPEPERFASAPPQAGHDLNNAWTEMQARGAPAEMLRARSSNGGWGAEFDGVAQIAQPAAGQQNMPMQSNCELQYSFWSHSVSRPSMHTFRTTVEAEKCMRV